MMCTPRHRTLATSLPIYWIYFLVRSFARMVASSWIGMIALLIAPADLDAQTAGAPSSTEKTAVDALMPWLLHADPPLREIAFSEVIFDTTGKQALAFNP